jgi:hypothetical protein
MVLINNQIVIEYDTHIESDGQWGNETKVPQLYRIISWKRSPDGELQWKEIKCPQNTFGSMKGYYNTLSVPVVFYNRDKGTMENSIPVPVNL